MFKLNNKGWGFVPFMFFLGIMLLAILLVVYLANSYEITLSSKVNESKDASQREVYLKYENTIKKKANSLLANGENRSVIDISELDINQAIKAQCKGYVSYNEIYHEYSPYIKCGNYETTGYKKK